LPPLELELPELELLVLPPLELELLELELLVAALAVLIATVADVGDPKRAVPSIEVRVTKKFLPRPAAVTGTEIILADVSPSLHVTEPLLGS